MTTKRVCLEPGCPTLTTTTRCTPHTRQRDQARGTTSDRGYGSNHQRIRAAWQHELDNGAIIYCWRGCGTRINPTAWQLGHDDNDRTIYRGPECVPCNTRTASRRTA